MILELLFLTLLLLVVAHLMEDVQDIQEASSFRNWSSADYGRAGIVDSLCPKVMSVFLSSNAACRPNREQGFRAISKIYVFDLLTSFYRVALSTKEVVIHSDDALTPRSELENRIRKKVVQYA